MKKGKLIYRQEKAALWLIKIALLFSVFTFSPYNEYLQATFQEGVKTELVFSQETIAVKTVLVSAQTFTKVSILDKLFGSICSQKFAILNYNQIIKTVYHTIRKGFLSYKPLLFISKYIYCSLSSSKDVPLSLFFLIF